MKKIQNDGVVSLDHDVLLQQMCNYTKRSSEPLIYCSFILRVCHLHIWHVRAMAYKSAFAHAFKMWVWRVRMSVCHIHGNVNNG